MSLTMALLDPVGRQPSVGLYMKGVVSEHSLNPPVGGF